MQSSQLHEFRHFTNCSAVCTMGAYENDGANTRFLGTSMSCWPTLRHKSIEDLHEGARFNPVLRNVPLNPLLQRRVRD